MWHKRNRGQLCGLSSGPSLTGYLAANLPQIPPRKPCGQNWCDFKSGIPHLRLVVEFRNDGFLYASLYSFGGHKDLFSKLEQEKEPIAAIMGEDVGFFNRRDTKFASLWVRRRADPEDKQEWPELLEWMRPRLLKLWSLTPLVSAAIDDMSF